MRKKDLAQGLNLSLTMVDRLLRRGMPSDSIEGAKRWRAKNLMSTKTKQHRADGNSGVGEPRQSRHQRRRPPAREAVATHESARREVAMFLAAAYFTAEFGSERFGPLLMHLAGAMSEVAHDAMTLDGRELPAAVNAAFEEMSAVYFEWLPAQSPQARKLDELAAAALTHCRVRTDA